ncbi:hypothetical protein BH11BAC6_BH11BAC6_08510 [soil metagenome]
MNYLKRYTALVFALMFCTTVLAQQKVDFIIKGNLRTVFELAKAQHKKVFLEIFANDCHTCMSFEPVFANAEVAKYYNEHFICYKLDSYSMETQAFVQKQKLNIVSTPTFLFYDENVKLIYMSALKDGQNVPSIVIDEAKKALK